MQKDRTTTYKVISYTLLLLFLYLLETATGLNGVRLFGVRLDLLFSVPAAVALMEDPAVGASAAVLYGICCAGGWNQRAVFAPHLAVSFAPDGWRYADIARIAVFTCCVDWYRLSDDALSQVHVWGNFGSRRTVTHHLFARLPLGTAV